MRGVIKGLRKMKAREISISYEIKLPFLCRTIHFISFIDGCLSAELISKGLTTYRKIPNISPGLIKVRKHFLGAYIRKEFWVKR